MWIRVSMVLLGLLLSGSAAATAQDRSIGVGAGIFSFDLSGTGDTPSVAVTAGWNPIGSWIFGGEVTFAFPEQQFDDRTTFVIPEAVVQYQWTLGRIAPFVGGGIGAAIDVRDSDVGGTDTDLGLSGGGGVRVSLTDSLGARGDFRLRGFGTSFAGSAAELRGGLFWRF